MAETKTAAYICKGCEIDKRVDVAALVKTATKSGKMNLVREHDFLCSADGVAMIVCDMVILPDSSLVAAQGGARGIATDGARGRTWHIF